MSMMTHAARTLPVLMLVLMTSLLTNTARAQDPDVDARIAQHAQLVNDANAKIAALNTAIEARRGTASQVLAVLARATADGWEVDADWWFADPWRADLPGYVIDNGSREAPQDRDFDRSLPEYLLLLETRSRLDRLNRWKLENEAALAWCSTRGERLRQARDLLQQATSELEAVKSAAPAAVAAVTAANEARNALLAALAADDPRRAKLAPDVRVDETVINGDVPVPLPNIDLMVAGLNGALLFVDKMSNTFDDQRKLRGTQEDLLLERRLLLQADLRRKTAGGERLQPEGVELGQLDTLFARYESIGEQLFNLRDLLLACRQETALVDHAEVLLGDEVKRLGIAADRTPPVIEPAPSEPFRFVSAVYTAWRDAYRRFLGTPTTRGGAGPVFERLNGADGERRRTRTTTEQWQRSISGMSSDQKQLVDRIEKGLPNIRGEPGAVLAFFSERAARESVRLERASQSLQSIETEIAAVRQEQEDLTTLIAATEQELATLRAAPPPTSTMAMKDRVRRMSALDQRLANARSRQPILAPRATLMEEARTDTTKQIADHNRLLALWQSQADAATQRLSAQQTAEEQRLHDEQMWKVINAGILIGVTVLIGLLIMRGMRMFAQRLEAQLADVSRRQARVRVQRARTVFYFVHSMTSICIVLGTGIVVLYAVGIGEDLISWLVGSVGVVALAVSFGAQSLIRDFFNGFFILLENQYVAGDWVRIGDIEGTVESVGLRTTVLRDVDGARHVIVNGSISHVANMTARYSRAIIDLGLSYADNPDDVIPALEEFCLKMGEDEIIKDLLMPLIDKPQVLGVQRFDDSAIIYRLNLACRPGMQWQLARRVRRLFFRLAEAKGFNIPFPHRTVYLHDADKGAAAK